MSPGTKLGMLTDIVVYYSNEPGGFRLVAHRITNIFNNIFIITKGDNNFCADKPIKAKQLIGKVVKIKKQEKDESYSNT